MGGESEGRGSSVSYVSTVVLYVSSLDGDPDHAMERVGIAGKTNLSPIEAVQAWLAERKMGELVDVTNQGGGNKGPEGSVFLGGFNYLDVDKFAALVCSLPWVFEFEVALVVNSNGGTTRFFRVKRGENCVEELGAT